MNTEQNMNTAENGGSELNVQLCDKRGLSKWCNDRDVKKVQLRSQAQGGPGKKNEFNGDAVNMCSECRKSNRGTVKMVA
jgi:hypothetical protein